MSMFICGRCDNLRDSDDGCEEGPNNSLICEDCLSNTPEDETRAAMNREFTAEQQRIIDAHMAEDDGEGP